MIQLRFCRMRFIQNKIQRLSSINQNEDENVATLSVITSVTFLCCIKITMPLNVNRDFRTYLHYFVRVYFVEIGRHPFEKVSGKA